MHTCEHERDTGYPSHEDDRVILNFMLKLRRYGRKNGLFEQYANTLRILVSGIQDNKMKVTGKLYGFYLRVQHDVHKFIELYDKHEEYVNIFFIMFNEHRRILHREEGYTLFRTCIGGEAFDKLDDVMGTLSLV